VLERVTHHTIFEGLGPHMMVYIHRVLIEPNYKFLPKSFGRVALLQLLRYSGVELIEFSGSVEQMHCSWPYGTVIGGTMPWWMFLRTLSLWGSSN